MRDYVVRGLTVDVPASVQDDLLIFRYQQEFNLSYNDVLREPEEALERAILIWSLYDERDKLEEKRRQRDN